MPMVPSLSKGDKGDTGKSAYQSAVDGGFVGTEAAWVASLAGADGADAVGIDLATFQALVAAAADFAAFKVAVAALT